MFLPLFLYMRLAICARIGYCCSCKQCGPWASLLKSVLHVVIIHVTVFHQKRVKYWRNDKIDLYKPAIFSLRVNSPPQFIVG